MDVLLKKNELLQEMVKVALPVAESDPLGDKPSAIYRLARNVLRKNIMRLQAISVLNTFEKMSDSALEIARNIVEDTISLSYILSDDNPEKLADEFFQFRHMQAKQDLDYYSKLPDYIGEDLEKNRAIINQEYRRVIKDYPSFTKDGSPRHSWSEDGVEGMARTLVKRRHYTKGEIRNVLRVYQLGSRKVHFNPHDILNYHDQFVWDKETKRALEFSIKGAAASFTSLVVRYYDTVRHYDSSINDKEVIEQLYQLLEKINNDADELSTPAP